MFIVFNRCHLGPSCPHWLGDNMCELDIDEEKAQIYECPQEAIDDDEDWDEEMEEHFDLDNPNLNDQFCGD